MYGLGGLGQVEVGERRRRAKLLEEKEKEKKEEKKEKEEKTKDRSVPDGSDKHLGLSAIATIPSAQTAPHYQRLKKALCPPLPHLWSLIRRVASSVPPLFPPLPPVLSHIGDFLSDQSILSEHISCTAWNSFDLEKNLTVNTKDRFLCCVI